MQPTGLRWFCSMWPLLFQQDSLHVFSWWKKQGSKTVERVSTSQASDGVTFVSVPLAKASYKVKAQSWHGKGSTQGHGSGEGWNLGSFNQCTTHNLGIFFIECMLPRQWFPSFPNSEKAISLDLHALVQPGPERVMVLVKTGLSWVGSCSAHSLRCSTCSR